MKRSLFTLVLVAFLAPGSVSAELLPTSRVINNVPAYKWYHGDAPTSVAMIMGYWENRGYAQLLTGLDSYPGWEYIRQTESVASCISSASHNSQYDPVPDAPVYPVLPRTSIADFLGTSIDPLPYGCTNLAACSYQMQQWAGYRGYPYSTIQQKNFLFDDGIWMKTYLALGCPLLTTIDSDGNGISDQMVCTIGYEDRSDGLYYAFYSMSSEDEDCIAWNPYRAVGTAPYGIHQMFAFVPSRIDQSALLTPEPVALAMLAAALLAAVILHKLLQIY